MRKITLLIMILCTISTMYAKRYYVQLGANSPTAPTWTVTIDPADELVDLTVKATSLRLWLSGLTPAPAANDEMWFAAGTYQSDINAGSTTTRMFSIKNGVKYYGGFAGTETSISQRAVGANSWDFTNETIMDGRKGDGYYGAAQGLFAQFPNNLTDTVFFNGFTVKNFKRVMTATGAGGAVIIYNYTRIQNCKFTDNVMTGTAALANGGAVFNIQYTGTTVPSSIENCYFADNVSDKSGGTTGVMYGGVGVLNSIALIKGCTFENNSSTGHTGALYIGQSANGLLGGLTLENCIFKGNQANGGNGGALYFQQQNATAPVNTETIKNCQFISNTCSTSGGTAIHVNSGTKSKLDIQGCTFVGNYSAASGGVALNINSTVIQSLAPVKNCIFRDNSGSATGTGEGVALSTVFPATTVYNCVFANNGGGASAVYLNANDAKIYNSTFANNAGIALKFGETTTGNDAQNNVLWNNTDNTITGGTTPTLDYNAYSGATGADAGTHSINTLSVSPNNTFVNPTTTYTGPDYVGKKAESDAANWALLNTCPAVDAAGTNLSTTVTTSINGLRPIGPMDMGAYETQFTTSIIDSKSTSFIKTTANGLLISGVSAGETISVYTTAGMLMAEKMTTANETSISLQRGIYLVRYNNKMSKVIIH